MAGDFWPPEKEEALVAIWKVFPAFLTDLVKSIVFAENEPFASTKTSSLWRF